MSEQPLKKVLVVVAKAKGHGSAHRWWNHGETECQVDASAAAPNMAVRTKDDIGKPVVISASQLKDLRNDPHVVLKHLDGADATEVALTAKQLDAAGAQAAADAARIAELGAQVDDLKAQVAEATKKAAAAAEAQMAAEKKCAEALEAKAVAMSACEDLKAQVAEATKKAAAAGASKK